MRGANLQLFCDEWSGVNETAAQAISSSTVLPGLPSGADKEDICAGAGAWAGCWRAEGPRLCGTSQRAGVGLRQIHREAPCRPRFRLDLTGVV